VVGPLSLLNESVMHGSQVLIALRNGKKLLGRVRAFDRHMNLILTDVCEMWMKVFTSGKRKGQPMGPIHKDRYISKMLLRGDAIVMVMKNPKKPKQLDEQEKEKEHEETEMECAMGMERDQEEEETEKEKEIEKGN